MRNGTNGNRSKVNNFMRGGDVMTGSRVDNDEKITAPDQSKHLLTHAVRGTARIGEILPVDLIHVLPHDDYRVDLSHTAQFQPMNKPTFDNIVTKMHSFNVRYNDIFGEYFKIFFTGGKKGLSKRNLPYYEFMGADSRSNSNRYSTDLILSIAMLAYAYSHKTSFANVHAWISDKITGTGKFDVERVKIVFNAAFGKGSILDMLNLGVGEFGFNYTDGSTPLSTVDWRIPTCIPIAPLAAYQLIVNKNYRIDDYSYDRFYEYEDIASKFSRFTQPATQRIDQETLADYTNTDVQIPYGTIIRHLDKLYVADKSTVDFTLDVNEMKFTLNHDQSFSIVKNGSEVPLTGWRPNNRGDAYPYVVSFSPACAMLAWLLSKSSVPMEKDYPTMILPRTQRGIVESINSSTGFTSNVAPLTVPVSEDSNQPKLVFMGSDGHKYEFKNLPWNSSGTATGALVLDSRTDVAYADFQGGSPSSSLDMNTLRWINAVTKLAEKKELVGADYGKQLLALYGVEPSWSLIDGCQYLGGLVASPRIDKVDSTSNTLNAEGGASLADFAGNASQYERGNFTFHSDDFGMLITVMYSYIEASYSRYIDRNAFKLFDVSTWFEPDFEGLTEQHLYKEEFRGCDTLRLAGLVNGLDDYDMLGSVLGYVPRNQEYRQMMNTVHGELIPSLGVEDEIVWTAARDFNNKYLIEDDYTAHTKEDFELNLLDETGLLYTSVENVENSRLFQFDTELYPPIVFTCSFGVDVLRDVHKIHLPITL